MPCHGVLLINLGSPDSTSVPDVRRYLREFLMDPRVIDVPYLLRFAIVHGAVLPFRPHVSAEAYRQIWTDEGSPLIAISRRLRDALRQRMELPVELAMRYQNPDIASALRALVEAGVDRVLVAPLFPHYAMSSYESAVERVKEVAAGRMELEVLPPYFDHPNYIRALVTVAGRALATDYDHFLFSFHGVPERHVRKTDPTGCHCLQAVDCCEGSAPAHATCYRRQCLTTMKRFAEEAHLPAGKYSYAFQSRLGQDKWLSPASQDEMVRLARAGVRKLVVISPAFTVDCLETLEEIGIRGRNAFLEAGGEQMTLAPCLNDHPAWVEALAGMVKPARLCSTDNTLPLLPETSPLPCIRTR